MIQGKAALDHCGRVEPECEQQQKVVHPVVLPKTFSPKEDRVDRAARVSDYGQQEKMAIGVFVREPVHDDRLIRRMDRASCNWRVAGSRRREEAESRIDAHRHPPPHVGGYGVTFGFSIEAMR
jgi:hypothetical protein